MNNRRNLVMALGAGAFAAPFGAFSQQQGKVWRVGYLAPAGRPASIAPSFLGGFPIHGVLVVRATAINPILAPSYRRYSAETTEQSQVASAMRAYGVQPARGDA